MKKLSNYKITEFTINKHKFTWKLLWIITFVLLFPFAIIQVLNDIFEIILNLGIKVREYIVHTIFKLMFKKDCRYESED